MRNEVPMADKPSPTTITIHAHVADFPSNVGFGRSAKEATDELEASIRRDLPPCDDIDGIVFDALINGYSFEATMSYSAARRLVEDMIGKVAALPVLYRVGVL